MRVKLFRFATIMLAAFSLSLSMAHLLELPQRIAFDQEPGVRVMVVEGVYKYFGIVGSVFELGAILMAFVLSLLLRKRGSTFYWTLGGALLLLVAFASWIVFVNAAIHAFIKLGGLSLLVISIFAEEKRQVRGRSIYVDNRWYSS